MSDVWKNVLAEIEQTVSHEQYATWFTGAELVNIEGGVVTIGVPNVFKITQLERKYFDTISKAFAHNDIKVTEIKYIVQSTVKPKVRAREITQTIRETPVPLTQVIDREHFSKLGRTFQTGLNPNYSLANFVVGSNNDLAVSVARNIIDRPGTNYNPFFLYGRSGLGKTHLVQAIGNELLARDAKLKVLYAPVSDFYSDFIKAVQNKKTDEFRQKFRRLDVLIIDDFQMIMGKDASQVEFFDIFNDLYTHNKQIIVTSDRLPSQIKSMDERLASRLTWAGAYDLQLPQFEDKCAILRAKAEYNNIEIEDAAIEYLAENVKTNIRDLEGEFSRLIATAELKNITPLEVISEGYASMTRNPQSKTVSSKVVVEKVAKYFQLTPKEMCSKSRIAHIKNARQVAMYILAKELGMSTPKIAAEVGVKDHTTVMHGIRKIEADMKLNFGLRDQILEIREKIYG